MSNIIKKILIYIFQQGILIWSIQILSKISISIIAILTILGKLVNPHMEAILQAQRLLAEKNYGNALSIIKQVLNNDDLNNGQLYFLMGQIYDGMGDFETANSYYSICLEFEPNHRRCLLQLGILNYKDQKYLLAIDFLEKCISLNDRNSEAYFYIGRVLQTQNKLNEARSNYRKCLEVRPGDMKCRKILSKLQKKIQKFSSKSQEDIVKLKQKLFAVQKQNQELKKISQQVKHLCVVCMQNDSHWINKMCGHCSVCGQCKQLIKNKCPICTKQGQYIKIYFP